MTRLLLGLVLAVGLPAQTAPKVHNFGVVVKDEVYRGAQPTSADLNSLANFGIKTVIDLRGDKTVEQEHTVVEDVLHLHFVNVPMNGLAAPSDEQIQQVLAAIATSPKPVFIHCKYGADRTGTVVAALRIAAGWPNAEALQEAKIYHINFLQFGMKHYIAHYRPAGDPHRN